MYAVLDDGFDQVAAWVASWNPEITNEPRDDAGGVALYWFSSPKWHVLEVLAHHAVLLPLIFYLQRFAWPVEIPRRPAKTSSADVWRGVARDMTVAEDAAAAAARVTRPIPWWLDAADWLLRFACYGHAVATIWYKAQTGRFVYLWQPCHLSNYVLAALCLLDGPLADRVFTYYINFWYGTMLALATPDLRGLHRPGEQFNFFSQHVMLLLLPAVWIAKRRFTIYRSWRITTMVWAVQFLLHFDLLLPASILLHGNVNYMMVPPSVYPASFYPHLYRPISGLFCILLTFFSRYVFAEGIIWLSGVRGEVQREQEAIAAALTAKAAPSAEAERPPALVTAVDETAGAAPASAGRRKRSSSPSPRSPPASAGGARSNGGMRQRVR